MGNTVTLRVHKKRLVRTKVIFSAASAGLIACVIGFSIFLRGFFYVFAESKIGVEAFTYKVGYAQDNHVNLISSVLFAITGEIPWETPPSQGNAESVPVLLYHGITSAPDGSDVTVADFQKQMFLLKKAGYQTVTLKDFQEFVNGTKKLPAKSFLLTFDDGRKDSYYPVDPILKALNYNAVMFVITRYSLMQESGPYYLSLTELKNLLASGRWEIEMHTRDGHTFYHIDQKGTPGHFYSDKLWIFKDSRPETAEEFRARVHDDLIGAYQDLKTSLGIAATAFAYPFGDYGQNSTTYPEAKDIVPKETAQVYPTAFYQAWIGEGYTGNYPGTNYLKKRLDVRPDWTPEYLVDVLESGQYKQLPYIDSFDHSRPTDWIRMWGDVSVKDGALHLDTAKDNNGTAALLNGSLPWKDYMVEASVDQEEGSYATIFGRMHDKDNYVSCDFGKYQTFISQRAQAKDTRLVSADHFPVVNYRNLSLGMKVHGPEVTCFINGIQVARAEIADPVLRVSGGIGFKVWDPQNNVASLVVDGIRVDQQ